MNGDSLLGPCRAPYAITPHNTNALPEVTKGIYVGTAGDVRLVGVGSETPVTYKNLPNGSYINVRAKRVLVTGTTASDLIGEA